MLLLLWRIIASTKKDLNHRIDRQGEDLKSDVVGLKSDVVGLKAGQAGLAAGQAELRADMKAGQAELRADMKAGQAELKAGQARMGENILQLFGGLGEVRGELKRIAPRPRPREKVGAGGS